MARTLLAFWLSLFASNGLEGANLVNPDLIVVLYDVNGVTRIMGFFNCYDDAEQWGYIAAAQKFIDRYRVCKLVDMEKKT